MSAQPKREGYVTRDQYFDLLLQGETKYEWFNGMIWPVGNPDNLPNLMAGAQPVHNTLKNNVETRLTVQLENEPCFVFSSDQQTKVEKTGLLFFPDIAVVCENARYEKNRGLDTLLNPIVLVEILSPSTSNFDRTDKWAHYRLLPSLRDYLVVFSTQWRVEHFARRDDTWTHNVLTAAEDVVELSGLPCRLALAAIYRRVELGEPLPQLPLS